MPTHVRCIYLYIDPVLRGRQLPAVIMMSVCSLFSLLVRIVRFFFSFFVVVCLSLVALLYFDGTAFCSTKYIYNIFGLSIEPSSGRINLDAMLFFFGVIHFRRLLFPYIHFMRTIIILRDMIQSQKKKKKKMNESVEDENILS